MPERPSTKPPIFILGVPRSGTTLLRTILDSHPSIACGPETPWLCAHHPTSVMALYDYLRAHPLGYCANFGVNPSVPRAAARRLVDDLLGSYAAAKGKPRWAEKTPNNALHLDFLLDVFPDAKYVHLVRDGLDVALSTTVVAAHRRGVSPLYETALPLASGLPVESNLFNAVLRWSHWTRKIARAFCGRELLTVNYEELVTDPAPTMGRVFAFLDEPFDPRALDYTTTAHDWPAWEWGSADVRARGAILADSVGRWRNEMSQEDHSILLPLVHPGHALALPAGSPSPGEAATTRFLDYVNALAPSLGLHALGDGQHAHSAARLWDTVLQHRSLGDARLAHVGDPLASIPWLAALLGAEVHLIAPNADAIATLTRLRNALRVPVRWEIMAGDGSLWDRLSALLPHPPCPLYDILIVADEPGSPATPLLAAREAASVLTPGGLFAAISHDHPGFRHTLVNHPSAPMPIAQR